MTVQRSLFDAPIAHPIENAASWVAGTLSGSLTTAVAVVAVALLGLALLRGRLLVREAGEVVVGCFLLFGAAAIAAGLMGVGQDRAAVAASISPVTAPYTPEVPPTPPPVAYDPYGGATVRQDRR